jgi:cell wall-associated NlpC family hydrolase
VASGRRGGIAPGIAFRIFRKTSYPVCPSSNTTVTMPGLCRRRAAVCADTVPAQGPGIRPTKRHVPLILLLALAVLPLAEPAVTAPPQIEAKQAEAQQVLAQIQQLDADLSHVIEAFNAEQIELERIVAEQKVNNRRLKIARANLGTAQGNLEARLVDLYVNGSPDLVEIILGSSSLDEILDGIESANRVTDQDAQILAEVRRFKKEIKEREAKLAKARERQEEIVAAQEAKRDEIEAALQQRESLYDSIKDQIAELEAAERRRQARINAAAEARVAVSSSSGGGGEAPTGAPPSQYGGVVGIAMQYLGIPYHWGGSSPSTGFDCSGFTMYVFSRVGVSLPHNAAMQYGYGSAVSRSELQAGDLVFFNGLGHVGIYIGGNQFIHSPHTGDVVKISSITGWYADTWVGARRL